MDTYTVPDIIGRPITYWARDLDAARATARVIGLNPANVTPHQGTNQ